MFFVELVMQGVRGFRDLARLRFQGGFNFVAAGNEAGKTAAVDSIQRLLYPSSDAARMDALISRHAPDASRGALVVFSDDGSYYRVIQDFSKKAVNLSKYNAATKEFGLMLKEWESTTKFMNGLTTGMSEEEYARLFILKREHYCRQPSNRSSAAAMFFPAAPPQPKPAAAGRVSAQETRLAELRETLNKSEEAADAEYKWHSAKLKLDELLNKKESFDQFDTKYSYIRENLDARAGCERLPENLDELIETHDQRQGQKADSVSQVEEDIERLNVQLDSIPAAEFTRDKLFIGGVALGVLSVIAGLFILSKEQADYFPIGVLVSLVLVAAAWYLTTQRNAQRRIVMGEVKTLEEELAALEKSFEQGGAEVQSYLRSTGSSTTLELQEKMENYRFFRTQLAEFNEERLRVLGSETQEELAAEIRKQEDEVNELEQDSHALAQNAVDAYSVRQEIERIESEAAAAGSFDFGAPDHDLAPEFSAPVSAGTGDRFFSELGIAGRIGGIEVETLIPAVEAAAQRNFSSVTAGKYVRVEVGQDIELAVHDKDHVRVGFVDLSHGTRELLYFCLRAGLVEALAGKLRVPFILDDPLAGFDPARQMAACQILRALGSKTQVILFTSNPALKAAGDAAVELK